MTEWGVLFYLFSLLLNQLFTLRQPSTPSIAKPEYCVVLAKPKSMNHKMLFAVMEMGSAIWAKESM